MPEHAEVRIASSYINEEISGLIFDRMGISDVTQNKINTNIPFSCFKLTSSTRGKEIRFLLQSLDEKNQFKMLVAGFGMTGNWLVLSEEEFKKTPHIHLYFVGQDKNKKEWFLSFQDVRRFARWGWNNWSENRGPDPLYDTASFKNNILDNLHKKVFDGRICEVLMDQQYFNGIGNYLRAEILSRADINPFISAREALKQENNKLFKIILQVLQEAYSLGGAQLKDWKNPYGEERDSFMAWLQVYGKGECILDKQKRNFWYLSKWKIYINKK